jgi:hypothetical protein
MADLFDPTPTIKPIGQGNALFLADLAERIPDTEMRIRFTQGRYEDIHRPSIAGWRRLVGRS